MGPEGLKEVAESAMAKAHYLCRELCMLPGVKLRYEGPFFHEFVTRAPDEEKAREMLKALDAAGILGGLPIGAGKTLWCATEKVSKATLDEVVAIVKGVLA